MNSDYLPRLCFESSIINSSESNVDAFEKQLQKHNSSKTDNALNLIYSLFVGIISSTLSKRYFKYGKTIGIILALSSYILSKKAKVTVQKNE